MKTITTSLITTAEFSDDGKKRYLLKKIWDEQKPSLAIIMLVPSEAADIVLDNTTMLVLNNASRLGYGSVTVLNLFATVGDFDLKSTENDDKENTAMIIQTAKNVDTLVYAAGVGKSTNKKFIARQTKILEALRLYEKKLKYLSSKDGSSRFQHPLSPAVRTWYLSDMTIKELLGDSQPTANIEAPKKPSKQKKEPHSLML